MTAQRVASAGTATAVASIFIPARLPASGAASGALLQCATSGGAAQPAAAVPALTDRPAARAIPRAAPIPRLLVLGGFGETLDESRDESPASF